jgi:predicted Zn-dependent protease
MQKLIFLLCIAAGWQGWVHKDPAAGGHEAPPAYPKPTFLLVAMDKDVPGSTLLYLEQLLIDSLETSTRIYPWVLDAPTHSGVMYRKRYIADSLLAYLRQHKPLASTKHIWVSSSDIGSSLGSGANAGILGLSYLEGCCAVVSDYRLHKHGRSRDSVDHYLGRVVLHEAAHTLGLQHCTTPNCIMEQRQYHHAAASMQFFCPFCRTMLKDSRKRF